MATTYEIVADEKVVGTKSGKATAIALAKKLRASEKVAVAVRTGAGTVVFEMKAPKLRVITKHTPKYTRLDALKGDPIQVPAGYEVAYKREGFRAVILRSVTKNEDGKWEYALLATETGEFAAGFATTRECGAALRKNGGTFPKR